MFLLDTMVVSERTKSRPEPKVTAWLADTAPQSTFISVLTFGETLYGVLRLPPGARRDRLQDWFDNEFTGFFAGRIINADDRVSRAWAHLRTAIRANTTNTPPPVDCLIAATARAYGLTVVTRNERHFSLLGVPLINPWKS